MNRKQELELKKHFSDIGLCENLSEEEIEELTVIYSQEKIEDVP